MPTQARLDAPGILYHIMIRGIERRKIFINDRDPEDMLERLAKLLPETQTACYTWVFIGMEPREIFSKGKQQRKVKARSLFCFWPACAGTADRAVSELGMSLRELARRLEMSSPGVGF